MNKRGALFHWIVFGVLAAIGMFFIYTYGTGISQELKGPWQLGMVNLLYRSELDLLQLDAQARGAGWQTIALLAVNGGFVGNSPCGQGKGTRTWNNGEQWCLPEIKKNAETIFWEKFAELNKQPFSSLTILGSRISADGKTKTIKEGILYLQQYTYPYAFSVDLGYSFDEYDEIFAEARKLVDDCRNQKDLPTCFKKEKNERWFYGYSCLSPQELPTDRRVWTLCAKSPSGVVIQSVPLVYSFSLDFTPTAPFSVQGITVHFDQTTSNYEITFPYDSTADGYTLYYTTANVLNYQGKIEHLLLGNQQLKSVKIDPLLACSSNKEIGKAYHCGDSVVYRLDDSEIYYFTVTAMVGKEESDVAEFVVG